MANIVPPELDARAKFWSVEYEEEGEKHLAKMQTNIGTYIHK